MISIGKAGYVIGTVYSISHVYGKLHIIRSQYKKRDTALRVTMGGEYADSGASEERKIKCPVQRGDQSIHIGFEAAEDDAAGILQE